MARSKDKWKWIRRTFPTGEGERFVVAPTRNRKKSGGYINFWHVTAEHTYLYTFRPNKIYNRRRVWTEDLFRALEADLRSPTPSVTVIRFAVDGQLIFSGDDTSKEVPKTPEAPKRPDGWEAHLQKEEIRAWRSEMEGINLDELKDTPAPYILYGNHAKGGKEYAWKLFPNQPPRQGIVPGDHVLVDTAKGVLPVLVTRVEYAADKEQPTRSVIAKCKSPKEWEEYLARQEKKELRFKIEEAKRNEPAPFLVFGKFREASEKEYSWRLTPDKPKRQGIMPGDRVLAWTGSGWAQVVVTRVEEIGDREPPRGRIKKKLAPEEWIILK